MSGRIFLIDDSRGLVSMGETAYESEDLLQALIADYPDLLAGEQINPDQPRRWILVSREYGVPDQKDGSDRWSVDHFLLDQDGIPTLVEVKRSQDTRIRREVVGQMLDYAANAVVYTSVERIRAEFEHHCEESGTTSDHALANLLGDNGDVEHFWQNVNTNLLAGKIRMVFVADQIPAQLQRIVEFLNNQMSPAEVLAVEIRLFSGEGVRTLVPRVIGRTAEAQQTKITGRSRWDAETFFPTLEQSTSQQDVATAQKILEWTKTRNLRVWWGKGAVDGSYFPMFDCAGQTHWLFAVWTYGSVEIQFQHMPQRKVFASEERRRDLLGRLNAAIGLALPDDGIRRRLSLPLSALVGDEALQGFLAVWDWYMEEVKAATVNAVDASPRTG